MTENACGGQISISPTHLLHRAGQFADVLFAKQIGEADMTPRQYAVLACVARDEDISQADIVERTGIDRSTLADVVRRLVRRGLLERQRTRRDARRYAVRLTKQGREVLSSAEPAAKTADAHLLSTLTSDQRDEFVAALKQIVETLHRANGAG